jgi:hypothetical protein
MRVDSPARLIGLLSGMVKHPALAPLPGVGALLTTLLSLICTAPFVVVALKKVGPSTGISSEHIGEQYIMIKSGGLVNQEQLSGLATKEKKKKKKKKRAGVC